MSGQTRRQAASPIDKGVCSANQHQGHRTLPPHDHRPRRPGAGPHLRQRHHRLRRRAVGPALDHHRHQPRRHRPGPAAAAHGQVRLLRDHGGRSQATGLSARCGLRLQDRPPHHPQVHRPEPGARPDLRPVGAGAGREAGRAQRGAGDRHAGPASEAPGQAGRQGAPRGQERDHRRRPAAMAAAPTGAGMAGVGGPLRHRPRLARSAAGRAGRTTGKPGAARWTR